MNMYNSIPRRGAALLQGLLLCLVLLLGYASPSYARRPVAPGHRTCRVERVSRHHPRHHVRKGMVFHTRPVGGRHIICSGRKCWLADGVLYDIRPAGKKGVKYVVVKVIR